MVWALGDQVVSGLLWASAVLAGGDVIATQLVHPGGDRPFLGPKRGC